MTAKQASEALGISLSLIYQLAAENRIAHYRIGRSGRRGKLVFDEDSVRQFKESCRVTTTPEPSKYELKHLHP